MSKPTTPKQGSISFDDPTPMDTPTDVAVLDEPSEMVPATTGSYEQESDDLSLISFEKLQIINKVGPLSEEFPKNIGEWLYDESDVLGGDDLRVIVLGAPHWYEEDLEFGDDDIPQRFRTATAARQAGFVLPNEGASENKVINAGVLYLLIQHAEGTLEAPDGSLWMLAQLRIKKGGFTNTYVKWNTQRKTGRLKDALGGTIAGTWDLQINKRAYNGNTWYEPKLKKPAGEEAKTAPEFQTWLKEQFGSFFG